MKEQSINKGRRDFIKNTALGLTGATVFPSMFKGETGTKSQSKKRKFIFRKLGKTGIELPIISMGVLRADNPNLVTAALDAGIVHLDTGHYYQGGRNEGMVGKVVRDRPRDSFVLATKIVGDHMDRKTGFYTEQTKAEPFVKKFEISMKRLGLDYVDILHSHSLASRQATLFEPLLEALVKLKKSGRVRFIGVSTHKNEPEVIRAAADSNAYDIVLTAYNFLQPHRLEVEEAMAYAAKRGLGIVAMKTQAGGYWDSEGKHPINMKAALKWALQNENIHTAIPGFSTFDQMELDLSIMEDLALSPQEEEDLKLGKKLSLTGLYCQQCGKCIPQCKEHLEVPTLMRSFMYARGYKNFGLARETLDQVELPHLPCTDCSSCSIRCSMDFDIRSRIIDIARIKEIPADFLV